MRGTEVTILDNFSNARHSVIDRLGADHRRQRGQSSTPMSATPPRSMPPSPRRLRRCRAFRRAQGRVRKRRKPLDYFDVNIGGLTTLLRTMDAHDCRTLVFSSSATVYGVPDETPTPETAEFRGMNPYGQTKIIGEQMLNWLANPTRAGRSASCATSTPPARMPRHDRRGPARHPQQPDALHLQGRHRGAAEDLRLRRRLRHDRRHRRPRLHPCGGPRARSCPVAGAAVRNRRGPSW
jgi:hypothetical protein